MQTIISFIPILLVFVVMYFFMIVPEKKRKKQYDAMLGGLQLNDEIMTRGGVIGKIVSLEDDSLVLESGPNKTRIRFSKNAVANKIYKDDQKKEDKKKVD